MWKHQRGDSEGHGQGSSTKRGARMSPPKATSMAQVPGQACGGDRNLGKSPGGCGDLGTEPQDGNAEHSRAGEGAQRRRE